MSGCCGSHSTTTTTWHQAEAVREEDGKDGAEFSLALWAVMFSGALAQAALVQGNNQVVGDTHTASGGGAAAVAAG